MAYAGWEDDPYHLSDWPQEWQRAYRAGLPPFDPALSEADHEMGRIPERIRTWPGTTASTGHVMRMVAVGAQAQWLTVGQPWHHPAGPGQRAGISGRCPPTVASGKAGQDRRRP